VFGYPRLFPAIVGCVRLAWRGIGLAWTRRAATTDGQRANEVSSGRRSAATNDRRRRRRRRLETLSGNREQENFTVNSRTGTHEQNGLSTSRPGFAAANEVVTLTRVTIEDERVV